MNRTLSGIPDENGRRFFVMPIGGHLDAHDGSTGYRSNYAGMLAGAEATRDGVTGGIHAAAVHQSMRERGSAKMQGEGLWAGVHGKAAPASWNGWQVSGLARLGVFNADMNRSVSVGSYARTAESDWTQVSGTAVVHAGYAFRPDERFTLMPFAGADAAFLHQPSISEEKGRSARLETGAETFRSVRAVFGLKAETADIATASPGYTAKGNASLAFNHELLKHAGDMTARFTEITGGDFTTDVRFAARSSISASAGISFRSPEGTSLDFALASEFSPGNGTSVGGFGKVQWTF